MWLHIPSTYCPSAPAAADLTSPSSLLWQRLASSALWRGKRQPPRSWRLAWLKASWTTHLSGAMCEPSEAELGVAAFIASLPVIPANLSAAPENVSAQGIPATCGRKSAGSSRKRAPKSCSSKTLTRISRSAPMSSSEAWSDLVTRVRSDCLRRQKLARNNSAGVSSSSPWPAATAMDSRGARNRTSSRQPDSKHHDGVTLCDAVLMWSAPTAHDGRRPGADIHSTQGRNLSREAAMWSTPTASLHNDGESSETWNARKERNAEKHGNNGMGTPLTMQASMWAPPTSRDHKRGDIPNRNGSASLSVQADSMWSAPTVADTEGGRKSRSGERSDELLLNGQAAALSTSVSILPVHKTRTPGGRSSRAKPRLAPRFVEWLMGWPDGWTSSAFLETEFIRWKALMRSELSRLCSLSVATTLRQASLLDAREIDAMTAAAPVRVKTAKPTPPAAAIAPRAFDLVDMMQRPTPTQRVRAQRSRKGPPTR